MLAPSLESALVRILRAEGELRRPVGAGFLVTPQHIVTCAHVVNTALGRSLNITDRPAPATEIFLDFPLLTNRPLLRAKILHWFPVQEASAVGDIEDIAVLEIMPETSLPDEARPAPVVLPHEQSFFDKRVRLCGFPAGADNGTYSNGVLQGLNAKGWVEIHHQGSEQIEAGFSGTAVWSAEENAAMGMTVSILNRQNTRVAYMIPTALLIKAFPDLNKHSRPANPYRGLEAFREQDARFYFGRESDTTALREKVEQKPFTAVIGASGSGKSSLVLAGVIPALRRTGNWLIADCRPKKQPFYELSSCLVPLLYDDELELIKRTRQCAADFAAGELSLSDLIRRIVQKKGAHRFLLVIDQFEELYTLNEATEARCFIDLLLEAEETDILSVVITMRADFIETALHYGVFAEALKKALIIVPPISEDGLREAVAKPAELFTVAFESGLIDLIIRDVGREPGSLPLLEFCLTQLWERQEFRQISHDAYNAIGGVQQALANHADAVYAEFDEQEREQLRHIFLKLVRPGQGTEDTRQVATVGQIQAEYRGLITRLADKRLIVTGRDEERGEETVEVVHEALIRRWQTLRQWVDEEREFLVWQEKLRGRVQEWRDSGQDEGALLRGLPLDEALRWRETHAVHLVDEELGFIKASEEAQRKQRRKKGIAVVAGMLLAAMVMVTFFVLWKDAERQKVIAELKTVEVEKEKDRAEQQTLEANSNLAKIFQEKALGALEQAQKEGDIQKYKQAVLFTSTTFEQQFEPENSVLGSVSVGKLFTTALFQNALAERWCSPAHQSNVSSVAFSSDGKLIASASGGNSAENIAQLWDVETGKKMKVLYGHSDRIMKVSFSPDGKKLASGSLDKTVRIWNIASGKEQQVLHGHTGWIFDLSFSPDGKLLASSSRDGTIRVWDVETGNEQQVLRGHTAIVSSVSFSPDSKRIASSAWDKSIRIWEVSTGKELMKLLGHAQAVQSVAFSPDGKRIVSAAGSDFSPSNDHTIRIWDSENGKELMKLEGHTLAVKRVSFSPDGNKILSSSFDDTVRIWDSNTGIILKILSGYKASFSPDGKLIASASENKVRLWDSANISDVNYLQGHDGAVFAISFSPDSRRLATADFNDKRILLWDPAKSEIVRILAGHTGAVNNLSFRADGKRLISTSNHDKTIRLWDSNTGRQLAVLQADYSVLAKFSPDGKWVASSSVDNSIRLLETTTGKEKAVLVGHTAPLRSISFSPNGNKLASASDDDFIRIWDHLSGKTVKVLKGHTGDVNYVSFSPDSRRLVSVSEDKTVRLWESKSGQELMVLNEYPSMADHNVLFSPDSKIFAVNGRKGVRFFSSATGNEFNILQKEKESPSLRSFSPNGDYIASASKNNNIEIWDIETGKKIAAFPGTQGNPVFIVVFSPDARMLAATYDSGMIRIWDISLLTPFLHNSKPTPLYHTFIDAVKFLWQLDVQGLEIVETNRRTPADLEKYGALLAPPPPGQSKFDQVLKWAERQQGIVSIQ